ncbi:ABC transporter permease [Jiangella anatolica]|uniref:ABC transporter permease n=1 Tax=Jiangella anatolica TaxID=2670374 RepID=A0A2W2BL35_9ACTN|nr:ABC transporter permease [Jiangella anatolica]PZF86732.1 ABC transporter permease [Jiangella anatolica]
MSAVEQLTPPPAVAEPGPRRWRRVTGRMGLGGLLGIGGLLALVVVSAAGRFLTDPPQPDIEAIAQGPSGEHPLGTDFTGRDNLHLVVRGGWDMLELAFVAGFLMSAIALTAGLLGAYVGGAVDRIVVSFIDLWLTVPRFVLLLVIASLFPVSSTVALAALIAVFEWPYLARQIRAQALSLRRREYVEAARLLQLRGGHIMLRYLIPAIGPFVVISTIQAMNTAIYQQVGLAFFGLVPLEDNWGVLFSVAYSQNALYLPAAAWSLLVPVAAICLLQFCLVLASRSLEELFDPRLRGAR